MTTTFTTAPNQRSALKQALEERPILVVALCAAWCDTCGQFRRAFDSIAAQRVGTTFVWLDVEDDADVAGDIDIDNFPTLAVYSDGHMVHFGVSLPQRGVVERLLDSLGQASATVSGPSEVEALPGLLRQTPADEGARRLGSMRP